MKDHRSLEQMYMDMATLNTEALTPAVKRAAQAIAKEFSKERNAAKKMKMADEVMQNILGEMLEYGTGKARDTYAKETPGQTAGEPEHHPEHARKVDVVLDGVPEKGGMIKKPTITTEAKKLDPVGKADDDIDNDGDVDSSDKYLHNRRKAIKKAMKKEEVEVLSSEEFADFVEDVMLDEVMSQAERIAAIRAAHAKIIKKEKQAERDAKRHMKSPGAQKGMAPVKKEVDEEVEESYRGKGGGYHYPDAVKDAVKAKMGKIKKSVSDFRKSDVAAQIRKNKTTKTLPEAKDHPAAADLHAYAKKHGGIDKEYFQSAANHIAAGRHRELAMHVKNGDTDPRDHVLDTIHKHDKSLSDKIHKAAGFKRLREENIDELSKKTMGDYIKKAADDRAMHNRLGRQFDTDNSKSGKELAKRHWQKNTSREKGIHRAVNKLTKEDTDQVNEYITGKQIRMAKGIAFDKRHKGGDMTGASKKMEKIKKGLSNHPAVKKALRTANESAQPTGVKSYHTSKDGKKSWSINFTADSARKHEASLKKDGHTVTHRSLMYGDKEGPKKKAL